MTELRFHRALYPGTAVDEAVKVYQPYGEFHLQEEPSHWLVQVSAASEKREKKLARELANYALGLAWKERKQ